MTRNQSTAVRNAAFAGVIIVPLIASLVYVLDVRTDWSRLSGSDEIVRSLLRFFPPNLSAIPGLIQPTIDTMLMAFMATLLIGVLVLPVIWMSALNVTPHPIFYYLGRGIIILSRSVHELIWALLFVVAVGLGPLPGILALAMRGIGFVAKVVAEEVEAIDLKPVEAIRATGASNLKVLILAVVPQVLPVYLGTLIFQWELDLRRAAVIGVVGAGGLGLAFHQSMIMMRWHDATAIVVILIFLVAIGEIISRWLRQRII
ncbi:MAG: phosphonate ABC transporter, permease protein PhnE [Hyphomicrobiaceae bacterium]|nr:phosphonate ABC transporter, permease protein PhnE [Hyphomicrobiaceae bacterium]